MELDSHPDDAARDRRLDAAMQLLAPQGRRRVPGLLILSVGLGLVVALMALAGNTVLAPAPKMKVAPAEVTPAQTSASPAFVLSSSSITAGPVEGAGLEGSR